MFARSVLTWGLLSIVVLSVVTTPAAATSAACTLSAAEGEEGVGCTAEEDGLDPIVVDGACARLIDLPRLLCIDAMNAGYEAIAALEATVTPLADCEKTGGVEGPDGGCTFSAAADTPAGPVGGTIGYETKSHKYVGKVTLIR